MNRHALVAMLGAALLGALGSSCGSSPEPPKVVEEPKLPDGTRWILDAKGRALVLHGVNASGSAKDDPLRSPNLADADIERIAHHWGFNFARYLVLWDALEPEAGKIDQAYVERVAKDVERLGAAGVYVMLDMHQDVYAKKFCCDGAPAWAIRDDGISFMQQTQWALNYEQPAVTRAFDNFWNASGPNADLQEHYANAWKALAKRFAGNPMVLGYDLMNEPFAGTDFDAIEALARNSPEDGGSSRRFDETKLGPFHQRMTNAIREVDPDHYVFFEPRYGAPANGSPSYLPKLDDPRKGERRVVFAPHLYSTSAEINGSFEPDDPTVSFWEQERAKERDAQKAPVLMGEWWAFQWTAPNAQTFTLGLLEMTDRLGVGWTYWSYGSGPPEGHALVAPDGSDNPVAKVVVRPYARAIAGEPGQWSYDPGARTFDLTFDRRTGATGPTELFLPEAQVFPKGWTLTVDSDPAGAWSSSFDAKTGILNVTVDPATAHHHVRVSPKE